MQKNKVCKGKVYCFKAYIYTNWQMQTHNYNPTQRLNIIIKYKICTESYSKTGTKWIAEGNLYKTKEEVIKSLTNN